MEMMMMQQRLETLHRRACISDEKSMPELMEALSHLQALPVTIQLLTSNKDIVMDIRSLKKHPNSDVRNFASLVIDSWKQKLSKQLPANNKSHNSRATSKLHQASLSKPKKETPDSITRKRKAITLKAKNSNHVRKKSNRKATDSHAEVNWDDEALRSHIKDQICKGLSLVFEEEKDGEMRIKMSACDPIQISTSLESTLYAMWGSPKNGSVAHKYRSLLFNIMDTGNPDFRRRVLVGEIEVEKVAEMNAREMASDKRKREIQAIEARGLWKCQVKRDAEATTDQFRCGKCGQRQTTYTQVQSRSADEPMTTHVSCVVCNNHWKFC